MSICILSGGVGGAKLVAGFADGYAPGRLNVIANTGDDFEHLALPVSPDLDTLMYTLAGVANPETGWGLVGESFEFMAALKALGGDDWFILGDKDIATHVRRRELLNSGASLSEATRELCQSFEVQLNVIPMSNEPVATIVSTDEGELAFQEYFVKRQAEPQVSALRFDGSDTAKAAPDALAALTADDLEAVVITPSNPYLSIDPILSIAEIRAAVANAGVPVIAVSPIVGGKALKGPTAKIMQELGLESSVHSIAEHYRDIIDGLVIDTADAASLNDIEALGIRCAVTNTVMTGIDSKRQLAEAVMGFAEQLAAA